MVTLSLSSLMIFWGDTARWDEVNSPNSITVSGSIIDIYESAGWAGISSDNTFGAYDIATRARVKYDFKTQQGLSNTQDFYTNADAFCFISWSGCSAVRTFNNGVMTGTGISDETSNYHIDEGLWKSGEVKFYQDGSHQATHTTNIPDTAINYRLSASNGGHIYSDWVLLRKYIPPEPTVTFGNTEADLSDWLYNKQVTIQENSGTTLTDYQVKISVDYETGMNSDFSDLRFTDSDGTILLNYWMEEYTAGSSATVWVKVPSIPVSSEKTIYMYYGNGEASSLSDGDAVFKLFDDFGADSTLDTSKWVEITNTVDNVDWSSNEYVEISSYVTSGTKWYNIRQKEYYDLSYVAHFKVDIVSVTGVKKRKLIVYEEDENDNSIDAIINWGYGSSEGDDGDLTTGIKFWKLNLKTDGWESFTKNSLSDPWNTQRSNSYTEDKAKIRLWHYNNYLDAPSGLTQRWYYYFQRKYTSPEPNVTIEEPEPENNAPVLESQELYPCFPYTEDDLTLNVKCSDADAEDTITAYWSCYKNGLMQSQYTGSMQVSNNVEMTVETISNTDTTVGDEWYCECHCSDGTDSSVTGATSTRVIQAEPTCGIGSDCSLCTGWVNLTANDGTVLQVRDSDDPGTKYDQICCSGVVSGIDAIQPL